MFIRGFVSKQIFLKDHTSLRHEEREPQSQYNSRTQKLHNTLPVIESAGLKSNQLSTGFRSDYLWPKRQGHLYTSQSYPSRLVSLFLLAYRSVDQLSVFVLRNIREGS